MPAIAALIIGLFSRDLIYKILKYVFGGFLGLVSYSFMQTLIDKYINNFLSALMGTDSVGMLLNLSRLDDAISIIVGALVICVAIKAMGIKITGLGN